jgi:hypothetical protein
MKQPHNFRFVSTDVQTWKKQADALGLTLTEWITRKCNGVDRSVLQKGAISEGDGLAANPVATAHETTCGPQKPPAKKKTCKHGVERGYHCWQCGGVAVIDV